MAVGACSAYGSASAEGPAALTKAALQGPDVGPLYRNPAAPVADRVTDLLGRMSLDEKIGQMTQVDTTFLNNTADIATYKFGSILSGGDSLPQPNTPQAWADRYDSFQRVATSTSLGVPILYGVDAVHGFNGLYGATVFPHNIGLGATRDPALVQEIGRITALEVAGSGLNWAFSPCLCVARNIRWGRTYESFGETPDLVSQMAAIVTGYQGDTLGAAGHLLATAKHYVGDGATQGGVNEGDAVITEAELRSIHLPGYVEAIKRGVGSVMISFSSWNGQKMHSNKYLITDVLKGELGFKGFTVSDWAAIKKLPGDNAQQVRDSINAGLDMIMVPDDYRTFIDTLRAEVTAGRVPQSRIDDAVRRIVTKKFELGLFEHNMSDRSYFADLGSPAHRAVARQAVRESLVLLKNDGVLPARKDLPKIFVAGKNADDIGNQSGGWTASWQGKSGNVIPGTTVLAGIRSAVSSKTVLTYDRQATGIDKSYGLAIAVVGETPYAETMGDRPGSLTLDSEDKALLQTLAQSGVPTVAVLISGRPLIITDDLPNLKGFVAAWLPGSEGAGVADVLFGDFKPTGKLPHSWPRSEQQIPINVGDASYDPLFAYGFGLTYP